MTLRSPVRVAVSAAHFYSPAGRAEPGAVRAFVRDRVETVAAWEALWHSLHTASPSLHTASPGLEASGGGGGSGGSGSGSGGGSDSGSGSSSSGGGSAGTKNQFTTSTSLVVVYERLVAEPLVGYRTIADFLGLPVAGATAATGNGGGNGGGGGGAEGSAAAPEAFPLVIGDVVAATDSGAMRTMEAQGALPGKKAEARLRVCVRAVDLKAGTLACVCGHTLCAYACVLPQRSFATCAWV